MIQLDKKITDTKHMWFVFLVAISLVTSQRGYTKSVVETCSLQEDRPNFQDPKSSICDALQGSSSEQAHGLARETISILSQISDLSSDPRAGEYYQSLDRLATKLNADNFSEDLGASSELSDFIQTYETPARRQNQEVYFEQIKNLMSRSPIGRKALDCFYSIDDIFTLSEVEFSPPEEKSLVGTFNIRSIENGSFHKVMRFDLKNMAPARALSVVAHEMMHACDAGTFAHDHTEVNQATENFEQSQIELQVAVSELGARIRRDPFRSATREQDLAAAELILFGMLDDEQLAILTKEESASFRRLISRRDTNRRSLEQAQRRKLQTMALSEVKAYKLINVDYFKEYATEFPRYFCDQLTPIVHEGGILSSYGKSRSRLEVSLNDRSFIRQLISDYSVTNGYDPHAFYEERRADDGSTILENSMTQLQNRPYDPEFLQRLEEVYQSFLTEASS